MKPITDRTAGIRGKKVALTSILKWKMWSLMWKGRIYLDE